MALDEALLRCNKKPVLRIYSWNSATVSVGFFQKTDRELLQRCKQKNIDIIRRPTGGRAVLHDKELTYSVCSSYNDFPGPSSLKGIYQTLAGWKIKSLHKLALKASCSFDAAAGSYTKTSACFTTSTPYEISVSGKKIFGCAQKRGRSAFLQHGSVLIDHDSDMLSFLTSENCKTTGKFTTLRDEGCEISYPLLVEIFRETFEEVMNCNLIEGRPTDEEIACTLDLREHYKIAL